MQRFIRNVAVALALLGSAGLAQAADGDCLAKFYLAKSEACLNEVLASLRAAATAKPEVSFAMVGFLAGAIKSSPELEAKIVAAGGPPTMKTTILYALDRVGRGEAARRYALAAGLETALAALEKDPPPRLEAVAPRAAAADNDLLIGAFMATGEAAYIRAILDNFTAADDQQIAVAVRVALMQGRFADSDPRGGYRRLARVACAQYQCRRDMTAFSRVLTLASADWSLDSLAAKDELVRQTRDAFLASDSRVGAIERAERQAFASYVELVAAWTAAKNDPTGRDRTALEAALTAYENLGPAVDLLHPLTGGQ